MNPFERPPPFGLVRGWLGADTVRGLLGHAQARRDAFQNSTIGRRGLDRSIRTSLRVGDLGEFARPIRQKLRALVPDMVAQLGAPPFAPARLEVELVAHHDGAFFTQHIDTQHVRTATKRVISAVYYFHSEPKAFSGGILRLYSLSPSRAPDSIVDIEPINDSLVFFPSWYPHEVTLVNCPSRRFEDSRFAINFWVHAA